MNFLGISPFRRAEKPKASLTSPRLRADRQISPWFGTDCALLSCAGPVRGNNEDYVLALSQPVPAFSAQRIFAAALADGMGGHLAGETASRIAVETALEAIRDAEDGLAAEDRLLGALRHANEEVFRIAQTSADYEGMGTTLVLLLLTDLGASCAWIGDSRLYRWRDGRIEQMTRDDTLIREMVDEGLLLPSEAENHPERYVLSQALGTKPELRRQNLIGPIDLAVGDCLLVCSDGLHEVVPESTIARSLAGSDASAICHDLLNQAIRHGADDNISVVVIRIVALSTESASRRETAIQPRVVP